TRIEPKSSLKLWPCVGSARKPLRSHPVSGAGACGTSPDGGANAPSSAVMASKFASWSSVDIRNASTISNQSSCEPSSGGGRPALPWAQENSVREKYRPTPPSKDMKAPITLLPQMSAPSQNRQIGAVRNADCHLSPSAAREAEIPPCNHGSHTL